jgi:hypothetical protein
MDGNVKQDFVQVAGRILRFGPAARGTASGNRQFNPEERGLRFAPLQ